MKMCATKSRWMVSGDGNSPPKSRKAIHVPTSGTDSAMEYPIRRPVPESRSSGSEYPVKPLKMASRRSVSPIIQLISRGLRNAPVKNTRSRCTTMAATNTSAAQWCIWRMTSPARTSKLSFRTDA